MADIPTSRINYPNTKNSGDMVEHISYNQGPAKFEPHSSYSLGIKAFRSLKSPSYSRFCAVRLVHTRNPQVSSLFT